MKLTKKHFKAIAGILRGALQETDNDNTSERADMVERIIGDLSDYFASIADNFNAEKFREAVEGNEEDEDRYCVKCGKTSSLLESEDMCHTCAEERDR